MGVLEHDQPMTTRWVEVLPCWTERNHARVTARAVVQLAPVTVIWLLKPPLVVPHVFAVAAAGVTANSRAVASASVVLRSTQASLFRRHGRSGRNCACSGPDALPAKPQASIVDAWTVGLASPSRAYGPRRAP